MAIEEIFNKAAERVKELPKGSVSNEDQLELYSYFKQANGGDCTTGMFSPMSIFTFCNNLVLHCDH